MNLRSLLFFGTVLTKPCRVDVGLVISIAIGLNRVILEDDLLGRVAFTHLIHQEVIFSRTSFKNNTWNQA